MASVAFQWLPIKRGDPISSGAVMTGRTKSDGDVYIGRNSYGIGKLNVAEGKMWNLWVHGGSGATQEGEILVLTCGTPYHWEHVKKGDILPHDAVYGGMTATDGPSGVYACRHKDGEAGKLNLDGRKVCNMYYHGHWTHKDECEVLCVQGASCQMVQHIPAYAAVQRVPAYAAAAVAQPVGPVAPAYAVPQPVPPYAAASPIQPSAPQALSPNPAQALAGSPAFAQPVAAQATGGYGSPAGQGEVYAPVYAQPVPAPAAFTPAAQPQQQSGFGVGPTVGAVVGAGGGIGALVGGIAYAIAHAHAKKEDEHVERDWNPNATCDGLRAEARAEWLVQNEQLSWHDAHKRVMHEFPHQFGPHGHPTSGGHPHGRPTHGGHHHDHPHWDPNAICDGSRAEDRAQWLVNNKGMSWHEAQKKVMHEFPTLFRRPIWNPTAMCDGKLARDRCHWLMENQGLSHDAAVQCVMSEFPNRFA